jgi:drug/metabolite transporter (DMT)-like permease
MELIAGGIVLLIANTLLGEPASFEPAAVSAAALGGWAYLTVAGTIVTFAAYIWLLKRVSPTLVATYTFVNPVVAVLLGWAVLGERFGGMMAIGAVLVIGSVIGLLWPGQIATSDRDGLGLGA